MKPSRSGSLFEHDLRARRSWVEGSEINWM